MGLTAQVWQYFTIPTGDGSVNVVCQTDTPGGETGKGQVDAFGLMARGAGSHT
jgi:hypothetical protein